MTKEPRKTASAHFEGDCVVVDTDSRFCVYRAQPLNGMASPLERANKYLRALEAEGFKVKYLEYPR
jgi:hypothetical protein